MPIYSYKVKDSQGKTVTGRLNKEDLPSVVKKLKEMDCIIINIYKEKPGMFSLDITEKFAKIGLAEKVTFYIKLVNMLEAGVPLTKALELIKEQVSNRRFKKIMQDIHRNIVAGNSLSNSLSLYPNIFPELLINVVQSGETSGKLVEVLDEYAEFEEKKASLRQSIVSALFYPVILIISAVILMLIFFIYLMPKFVDLFNKTNIPLPLVTRTLVNIAGFCSKNAAVIITGIVISLILIKIFTMVRKGRFIIDSVKLSLPYIGVLVRKLSIVRFTRAFGTLYSSGVSILIALEICEKSTGNYLFETAIRRIKNEISKGKTLSAGMAEKRLFPPDVTEMVAIGETSGNLKDMLDKISDFYERDVEYLIKKLSSLIEPVIILLVGIVIGFLAYSVIMPIFDMMKIM